MQSAPDTEKKTTQKKCNTMFMEGGSFHLDYGD